jgi:hypothetical protein
MIDEEEFNWPLGGFQFQPELLLNSDSQDLLLPWVDLLVSRGYVVGDRSVRLGLIEASG